MSVKINARSPYYIKVAYTGLATTSLDLFIWTGLTSDKPVTATYTFTKASVLDNEYVVFEVSEYIKDFLSTEYNNYSTEIVWVSWDWTSYNSSSTEIDSGTSNNYLASKGYGYFEEGINPELSYQVLQSNNVIYYNINQPIVIPVWAEDIPTVSISGGSSPTWEVVTSFWEAYDDFWNGSNIPTIEITDNGNSNQKIQYIVIDSQSIASNAITIITSGINPSETIISLVEVCEPKYTPLNVIFFNKFGALQNIWMFKKSQTSINITSESYKRNILNTDTVLPSYSTTSHQMKTFNANGNESISMNTGYVSEDYNDVIRQLLLSEEVWVDNGTQVLPIKPNTNSLTFKNSVNDKLINYTVEFNYAYDKINNIR